MKKLQNKLLLPLLLLMAVALFSCDKNDNNNTSALPTLDELITKDSSLTLFSYAITRAKLTTFTKGGGPFTVFAPTNAGMQSVGLGSKSAIDAADTTFLTTFVISHFQGSNRSYNEIPRGPNAPMTMINGITVYGSRYENPAKGFINGAAINMGEAASNGYLYKYSGFIATLGANATDYMSRNPSLSLFLQAISKTAVTSTFNTASSTVLALPNNVMIANGYDSARIATLDAAGISTLSNILKYHVLNQLVFTSDFVNGTYTTRRSATPKVTAIVNGTSVQLKGASNTTPVNITSGNYIANTGVVHILDGMLKP